MLEGSNLLPLLHLALPSYSTSPHNDAGLRAELQSVGIECLPMINEPEPQLEDDKYVWNIVDSAYRNGTNIPLSATS